MTYFGETIPDQLTWLGEALENLLFPVLVLELLWLWRKGALNKFRTKEMLANAASLLIIIPAGYVGLILWFTLFEAIESAALFNFKTTWTTALFCIVLADLAYYAEHRFEHTHRLPWDLYHSVHHSSPEFDQTTSLRLSGFDALLTMGFLAPLVLLGFSPLLVLVSYGVVVGYQTWIHTELVNRTPRWFEFVFNTPAHHRVHHGADASYLDKNYGGILIVWDRLFGTFAQEVSRPTYGLTTQIESSNPIDVQFSEIRKLWADLRADSSWSTRFTRMWNPPGWDSKIPAPTNTSSR